MTDDGTETKTDSARLAFVVTCLLTDWKEKSDV